MSGLLERSVCERVENEGVAVVGEPTDLVARRPFGAVAVPGGRLVFRIDAARERGLEPFVDARPAEPLLYQRVDAECGEVPLVKDDGVTERDRARVIRLGSDDVEQLARSLAIVTVPIGKRLPVHDGRICCHGSSRIQSWLAGLLKPVSDGCEKGHHMKRSHLSGVLTGVAMGPLAIIRAPGVAAQQRAEMRDMQLVGFNDLQARSAYQPLIHKQGDRWLAYIGHHGGSQLNPLTGKQESNGTSVLDVTDPRRPKYLVHIPGETGQGEAGGAQMVRVCDGRELPHADKSKVYLLRTFGNSGHEVWDVTEPARPERLTVVVSGLRQTHKNWWECDTGIAYLVSGDPAWRTTRMTKIYDLSDPAHPVFIRDFGLPGQQPGSTGPIPTDLHGPISLGPKANRVYFGYGTGVRGIVQIVDREKLLNGPREPTDENRVYPQIPRVDLPPDVGAHTTFPLLGMDVAEFGMQKAPAGRRAAPADAAGGHDHEVSVPANQTQARRDFI